MFAKVKSYGLKGIEGYRVDVEVDVSGGVPFYNTVGLPDMAVRESKERVTAAMKNSRFLPPDGHVIVSLAPADTKKEGSLYDLPIALGLLTASHQIAAQRLNTYTILGELALDGTVRAVAGILPMIIDAAKGGDINFIIPKDNQAEAAYISDVNVFAVSSLREAADFLEGKADVCPCATSEYVPETKFSRADFSLIKGQFGAKRASEIAAAGAHNMLLIGTPGSGKTMLARSIPSILPQLSKEEAIEITKIHSVAGELDRNAGLAKERPFRSPHHTSSAVSLVGGGARAMPGEISLAHMGVLFLDEFPEYRREVLEALRQPLEDGFISVSRANSKVMYPAGFMLVAAMNPCPCGNYGSKHTRCTCSRMQIQKYLQRISGPMLDRIDLHVEMTEVDFKDITNAKPGESSAVIRERVNAAREMQRARFKDTDIHANSQMDSKSLETYCKTDESANRILQLANDKLHLSARGYTRVLKVARTIADLDASENITAAHISEAVQYRSINNKYWGSEE